MDATAEIGRNPVSEHQIQPLSMENEQADAGRDDRTRLTRPHSQARTGTGKKQFACSADHEQDWQPYPVDLYSCYSMCDDQTYIHTVTIISYKPHKSEEFLSTQQLEACTPGKGILTLNVKYS